MPGFWGNNIVTNTCGAAGSLLRPGQNCTMKCATGFTPESASQSLMYACDSNGYMSTVPDVVCKPSMLTSR